MPGPMFNRMARFQGRGAYPAVISTFISMNSSTVDATSHQFTSANFGQTDAHTYAVLIAGNRAAAAQTSSARSVGGVPFSIFLAGGTLGTSRMESWIARMPLTGPLTIDVTWTGTVTRAVYALFKIQGIQSTTPTNSGATTLDTTMTTGVLTGTANVSASGCLICFAINAAAGGFSWTNVTERGADVAPENLQFSVASDNFATAQSSLAITATAAGPPSALNPGLFGAAFR